MNWAEMDDKERVRLVLQHVMGCFVLEATAKGWRTPDIPRGLNAPAGFHWPIAFWNTDGECWMTRDSATDPTIFHPLRDMNDAWQIVEKLGKVGESNVYIGYVPEAYSRCEIIYYAEDRTIEAVGDTPMEAICKATLKAMGMLDEQGNVREE